MYLRALFVFLLSVSLIACSNKDDNEDINQTEISDESQVSAEVTRDGATVTTMQADEIAGPYANGIISLSATSSGALNQTLSLTIATDDPIGSYGIDSISPDPGEALVNYTNVDIQNGMAFQSTEGSVEVSRYEKVGELSGTEYYEMDGSFDVTAEEFSSGIRVQISGSFQDAFVSKP